MKVNYEEGFFSNTIWTWNFIADKEGAPLGCSGLYTKETKYFSCISVSAKSALRLINQNKFTIKPRKED